MCACRLVSALLLAALLAGCGAQTKPGEATTPGEGAEKASAAKQRVIGASLLTQTHVFYQDLVAAMEEEAGKQGFKLRVQYCENDGARQNNHIEMFVLQGVDAIIVSPQDSAAIVPAINEAREKGVPVFTADIAAPGADVVCHVASDNRDGGRIIGEYLAKVLNGKGKVAIIDYPEVKSVQDRVAGFEAALSAHPEITIVRKVSGLGQRDKAHRAAQNLLEALPGLDAIFGINDDTALGTLAAVEAAGRQDKIAIVGYDGTPEAVEAIRAGRALKADTIQHPKEIGKKTIEAIASYFRNEPPPPVILVPCDIVDAERLKTEPNP